MKFTCNRDNLVEAVNVVQRAISGKTTMPILEGILIEVVEELKMTANDLDLGITYEIPAIIEEVGSVLVSSKTFADIVRKLPDIYVTIETSEANNLIIITSGKARFEITMMDIDEYPQVSFIDEDESVTFENEVLKGLIKQSIFATADDDTKPMFKGVFIDKEGKTINFVALCNSKMAVKHAAMNNDKEFKILVPKRILSEVYKVLQLSDEDMAMAWSNTQVMFFNSHFKIISRLINSDYLKYRDLIPREDKLHVVVSTKDFLNAIERSALVMQDSSKYPMVLTTDMDEIVITAKAEKGFSEERLPAQVNGSSITIGFNTSNFIDCLKVIDDENISLHFTTSLGPCIVRGEEYDDYVFLVMPVRLR
ncbi:MAG: DNA polymerase III subunit beta [Clostridiaceae bacterium]|nr:DNA polymerase III subunit beta [Clostridiaceae bacterium]